jgi:hypothetical protein
MGDHQGQKLLGLAVEYSDGDDAIFGGAEPDRIPDISPALGVHPIIGVRVGIEKDFGVPPIRRHISDGVDFVDDVVPEGVQIRSTREDAGHADDGHISPDRDFT